eukprot:TRINITY_DN3490_c1_g1_i4.p2 TRINITY_DN3490_c1_g1~~TRINITY_DN3490_c1_g1_i4.p2  ORF type:complete len:220 (+),score=-30.82 TRINITY_DN3490_c1_g1_i4:281-940(+)
MVIQQCYYIQQVFYLSAMSIIMMVKLHMIQNTKMQHLFCLLITYIFIISFKKEKVMCFTQHKIVAAINYNESINCKLFFHTIKKIKKFKIPQKKFPQKNKNSYHKGFSSILARIKYTTVLTLLFCLFILTNKKNCRQFLQNCLKQVQYNINNTYLNINSNFACNKVLNYLSKKTLNKISIKFIINYHKVNRISLIKIGNNLSQFSNIFQPSYNQYQCYY